LLVGMKPQALTRSVAKPSAGRLRARLQGGGRRRRRRRREGAGGGEEEEEGGGEEEEEEERRRKKEEEGGEEDAQMSLTAEDDHTHKSVQRQQVVSGARKPVRAEERVHVGGLAWPGDLTAQRFFFR
jgi:hypothetical protein